MVRCESKDGHQKDMCSKEIELHAPNLLSILGSKIVNILGGTYVAFSWLYVSGLNNFIPIRH